MSHQDLFCLEHGKPIISFCISKHNCPERRLCNECINSNHNNQDQAFILLIDDFQKQLSERLIGYQKGEPCKMLNLVKEFQDQITKIFQDILTSVELVFKKFEEFDKNIQEIKIKLKSNSFLSFSQTDKQMMIEIVRDKLYCYEEQNAFRNKLEQISEQWRSYLEDSVQQLTYKERIDEYHLYSLIGRKIFYCFIIYILMSNIWIEGLKVMGYRQGDYYYCYENGSKELAGTYELGKEKGLWKIILGQKYLPCHIPGLFKIQKKQIVYKKINFQNGIEHNYLSENYTVRHVLFSIQDVTYDNFLINPLIQKKNQYFNMKRKKY